MNPGAWILDLLFPPKCPFCHRILEQPRALFCPDCQAQLPWLPPEKAERKCTFVEVCVSALRYKGLVQESIHRFKFKGRRWYAQTYGVLMSQCVQDHLQGRYDLICWVPVSARRKRERGYDQGYLLARVVSEQLGQECAWLLEKVKDNPAQSGLEGAAARRANVLGVYRVADPERVRGKRVLLVDDVVTTGETLPECARTLRVAGAAEVVCVTLARTG